MSNKFLFSPKVARNYAGGITNKLEPKLALAQLATTSCLNNTLYCDAKTQLNDVIAFANKCDPEYVAKVAVYSREKYYMKDIPALLCAILTANKKSDLLKKIFLRVINNGDMLRNYFQMIRSGVTGRRSFGSLPKQLMIDWFNCRTPDEIFEQSIGTPSMRDILRTIHPRPMDKVKDSLYGWLVGRKNCENLPTKVQEFESWKNKEILDLPNVPFQMLTSQKLSSQEWTKIANRAGWKWLVKNINTMSRNGVLDDPDMVKFVSDRISDPESIKKAKAFPYQILTAYLYGDKAPEKIKKALHDAMEVAIENVPQFGQEKGGNPPVYLMVDVSGSMKNLITGNRFGNYNRANTSIKCVDVAALISCSILRKNKNASIQLFNNKVVDCIINPNRTVMENSAKIANMAVGATACSAPIKELNDAGANGDLIILVSDNQSWVESLNIDPYGKKKSGQSNFQVEWNKFKLRNPNAKLVCIDIAPYATTEVQEREDVMNCGGWSDNVFNLIEQFANGEMNKDHLVGIINNVKLD